MEALLDGGGDASLKDAYGARAIHHAAMSGHQDIVRRLLDAWRTSHPDRPLSELVAATDIDRATGLAAATPGTFLALDGHAEPAFSVLGVCDDERAAHAVLNREFGTQRPPIGPLAIVEVRERGRTNAAPNLLRFGAESSVVEIDQSLRLEQVASRGPLLRRPFGLLPPVPKVAVARLMAMAGEHEASDARGLWFRVRLVRVLSYADGLCIASDRLETGKRNRCAGTERLWPP